MRISKENCAEQYMKNRITGVPGGENPHLLNFSQKLRICSSTDRPGGGGPPRHQVPSLLPQQEVELREDGHHVERGAQQGVEATPPARGQQGALGKEI